MSFLTLKDIGKIYVSNDGDKSGNVTVGIRGVNLSFDKGEFVAVTGKSGSGKSTLLNVISGMDSYEEGELFIESEPTSHFLQPDWEEYREKYISFIFQDYNIIDSFTVLQNVELALMHIDDKKERRKRALELIDRVGLTSHIKHKGSKLSGGQKQRTVIARALAKDSPIILADEPTGNLDSVTSKEIIELLYNVSRDKLLIIVTHDFDEVKDRATRHIRIYDGAVEGDYHIRDRETEGEKGENSQSSLPHNKKKNGNIKKGIELGKAMYFSKPKLSFFLCMLMIIGTLGIFFITASSGDAAYIFEKKYMFNPIDGRLVITKQNGEGITDKELDELVSELGAKNYLHYDILLDGGDAAKFYFENGDAVQSEDFVCTYGESFGDKVIGRYPEKDNEVLLYLPISYQPVFGKNTIEKDTLYFAQMELKVCGIKYFYDNNKEAKCLFTEKGFRIATAGFFLINNASVDVTVSGISQNGQVSFNYSKVSPSFKVEKNRMYFTAPEIEDYLSRNEKGSLTVTFVSYPSLAFDLDFEEMFNIKDLLENMTFGDLETQVMTKVFAGGYIADEDPDAVYLLKYGYQQPEVVMCPYLMMDFVEESLEESYTQASLFFESDSHAYAAAEKISEMGYIGVPSDTTYTPDGISTIMAMFSAVTTAIMWCVSIVFFSFVINLCSARALDAFKGDMAIMRSMGIGVKVIRIGMYVRMLMTLIPAYILVGVSAVLVFTLPQFNSAFTYLYWWQYLAIFGGMLALTVRVTRKQVKRLFGQSVKKSLKGGNK